MVAHRVHCRAEVDVSKTPVSRELVELLVENTVVPMVATKGIVQHDMPPAAQG